MRGAALMTGCVSAYVINDAFMKFLFSEIALFQGGVFTQYYYSSTSFADGLGYQSHT
jgi:hypothetical protein